MEKITQYYAFNKTSLEYARFLMEVYSYSPDITIHDALVLPDRKSAKHANITISFLIEKEIAAFLKLKYGAWFVNDPYEDFNKDLPTFDVNIWSAAYMHVNKINEYIKFDMLKSRNIKENTYKFDLELSKIKDFE